MVLEVEDLAAADVGDAGLRAILMKSVVLSLWVSPGSLRDLAPHATSITPDSKRTTSTIRLKVASFT